jgi:hypothetical protein
MKFAKIVFWIAGGWGVLVLAPLYFMFDTIGRQDPPVITHPQFFYGFAEPRGASFFEKERSNSTHPCGSSFQFVPEQRPKTGAGRCRCFHREGFAPREPTSAPGSHYDSST